MTAFLFSNSKLQLFFAFYFLFFSWIPFIKSDTTTDCLNACNQNDVVCRAKCVPVPFGGTESVMNTGNCIANCQHNFPKDPSAQSSCYSSCYHDFVNPPPHLQPPPPSPTPSATETPATHQIEKPSHSEGEKESDERPPTTLADSYAKHGLELPLATFCLIFLSFVFS